MHVRLLEMFYLPFLIGIHWMKVNVRPSGCGVNHKCTHLLNDLQVCVHCTLRSSRAIENVRQKSKCHGTDLDKRWCMWNASLRWFTSDEATRSKEEWRKGEPRSEMTTVAWIVINVNTRATRRVNFVVMNASPHHTCERVFFPAALALLLWYFSLGILSCVNHVSNTIYDVSTFVACMCARDTQQQQQQRPRAAHYSQSLPSTCCRPTKATQTQQEERKKEIKNERTNEKNGLPVNTYLM